MTALFFFSFQQAPTTVNLHDAANTCIRVQYLCLTQQFCFDTLRFDSIPQELRAGLELNFALNSKAFLIEHASDLVEFVGNRTECALLMLGRKWGGDYKALRDLHQPNVAHVSCRCHHLHGCGQSYAE